MNAIYILWLRQLKRYARSKSRMIASLGQPVLFLVAFGFGLGPVFQQAGQGSYIQFVAPGVIAMSILFTAIFTGLEVIWDRQFGFLKETMVAPVSRTNIMIGRTLGGATVSLIQGIILFFITLLVGFRPESIAMLPVALLAMILLGLFFTALGMAIAANLQDMQAFPLIMNFLVMPLFFLSGALFPLEGLPKALEIVTRLNPVSYGIDAMRGAFLGTMQFSFALDFGVLTVLTLLTIALGSYLFSKIQV